MNVFLIVYCILKEFNNFFLIINSLLCVIKKIERNNTVSFLHFQNAI